MVKWDFFDFLFGGNNNTEQIGKVPIKWDNKGAPVQYLNDKGKWQDFSEEEIEEMKQDCKKH